jgi:hypothetical protein
MRGRGLVTHRRVAAIVLTVLALGGGTLTAGAASAA